MTRALLLLLAIFCLNGCLIRTKKPEIATRQPTDYWIIITRETLPDGTTRLNERRVPVDPGMSPLLLFGVP
jgi:hypothetical protein